MTTMTTNRLEDITQAFFEFVYAVGDLDTAIKFERNITRYVVVPVPITVHYWTTLREIWEGMDHTHAMRTINVF